MRKNLAAGIVVPAFCLFLACDGGAVPASDPAVKAGSLIEGVWRIADITIKGANPSTVVDPPSVYIFMKTHYSMMRAVGAAGAERTLFKAIDPADAEKIAAYDSFVANTGTYDLTGTVLTVRPIVAKHPNFMGGGFDTYEVRAQSDTLWLENKSTNLRYRMGTGLVTSSAAVEERTIKLIRVE